MAIIQDFIPVGRRNRPASKNPCRYITIHETGNTAKGAGAKAHAAYLKGDTAANLPVSWHYTADSAEIVQHLPDNEGAYHASDGPTGPGNGSSIGIEIAVNADGDYALAVENTARLCALLCERHGLTEADLRQHRDWIGKNCPARMRAGELGGWAAFVERVRAMRAQGRTLACAPEETPARIPESGPPALHEALPADSVPSEWAWQAWSWASAAGVADGTRPKEPCTREETVAMLWRALGQHEPSGA